MRNLLAFVGAVVVTVGGAGYYLDWFKISKNPTPDGRRSFNVDVDTNKISQDLHKGTSKVHEFIDKAPKDLLDRADGTPKPLLPPDPSKDGSGKSLQFQVPFTGTNGVKPVKVEVPLPNQVPLPGGGRFKPFGGEESEPPYYGPPTDFSRPR